MPLRESEIENAAAVAVVAVGGNLPGAFRSVRAGLEAAVAALGDQGLTVVKRSRWRRTAAWPDAGEPEFLNGVLLVETSLPPVLALARLHAVEARFGRVRGEANAPRTVDLDLVAYGDQVIHTPELIVPHPRARDRLFVLEPLVEIAPDWRWPDGATAAESLERLRLRCAAA